jgi:hypothetical protein
LAVGGSEKKSKEKGLRTSTHRGGTGFVFIFFNGRKRDAAEEKLPVCVT